MRKLSINNTDYPVKWDYSVIRFFCNRRGIEKVADYAKRIGSIELDIEKLTIENFDDLSYLLLSLIDRGVEIEGGVNNLSLNDAFDWLYSDANHLTELLEIVSNAVRDVAVEKKTKAKKAN